MRHGSQPSYPAQTVRRVAQLLKAFEGRSTVGISELTVRTGLPRSSIHRIVSALVSEGLVVQDEDSRKYSLSLGVVELGASILRSNVIRRVSRPILMELRDETGESVHLGVLDHSHVVIIDTEDSYYFVREVNVPGQRLPCHAVSTGKVLLAYLPMARLQALLRLGPLQRFTENTITESDALEEELRQVRARGYAASCSELEQGVDAFAAAVFDSMGTAVAAISVGGPSVRISPKRDHLVQAVCRATNRSTSALSNIHWQ